MNKNILVAGLVVLTGLNAVTAMAADRAGAFFVRPAVGYYFPASKRHLNGTGVPQLSLGYDFTDRWAMAVGATVVNTDQKSSYGNAKVHGFLYTMDAIYRLNAYKGFSPYLLAGPQFTSLKPPTGSDPVTQAGASFGAGAGYYFSDSVGVSLEARDLYTFSGGKNDVLLTVGLNFLFGGDQPTPAHIDYKGEK